MHLLPALILSALILPATSINPKPPGQNAILLSTVQTLTLRSDRMTSSRRIAPIPQLNCIGPKQICNLYRPEIMRCTNQGYDYDEEDVQWTCTADIPPEFKLGATDVICEGYRNADDKWVLKGSCGVEYRMLLTEAGERKFGKKDGDWDAGRTGVVSFIGTVLECLFLALFFGVMLWVFAVIVWAMMAPFFGSQGRRDAGAGQGLGRGDGGGGGGPPPPPYNPSPPPYNPYDSYKSAERQQRWTPGFWTGALGGGVAGYQMGRHADSGSRRDTSRGRSGGYDPGEGSSRSPRFSSTTSTTATTTSTGFGSTRRR